VGQPPEPVMEPGAGGGIRVVAGAGGTGARCNRCIRIILQIAQNSQRMVMD
jgi:hypothetical protein